MRARLWSGEGGRAWLKLEEGPKIVIDKADVTKSSSSPSSLYAPKPVGLRARPPAPGYSSVSTSPTPLLHPAPAPPHQAQPPPSHLPTHKQTVVAPHEIALLLGAKETVGPHTAHHYGGWGGQDGSGVEGIDVRTAQK
ncbi:hypothetical protein GALMADRAFT_145752 [Galerina marginata CBS 339.88]|uniref:Uncharacterized protein n=1 Tax=Galerina marginata (strain CBS 339.88) TaxID=685588 RepID=A0A067SQH4_GALM3|nr:hypothetical protein GALMADRAFT_145752 [Galerina marginata CBS 339.88]